MLLDVENPRYIDVQELQSQAIGKMIEDQGGKLLRLAAHIVQYGINPSELPMVIETDGLEGKYTVLEGNRRIAAIKLFEDPGLAADEKYAQVKKSFENLRKRHQDSQMPRSLKCVLFNERSEALNWIELRHTGEKRGAGIVGWNAAATSRFLSRFRKKPFVVQVFDFFIENAKLTSYEKRKLDGIAETNLKRLVEDPNLRRAFGYEMQDGDLVIYAPVDEVLRPLRKVFGDLAEKRIRVKDIYTVEDRQNYLRSFKPGELPSTTFIEVGSETPSIGTTKIAKPKGVTVKIGVPISTARKTLIPDDLTLNISQPRINDIFHELKRINVDINPNAVSVTFRVFLEASVNSFMERNGIHKNSNDTLNQRLHKVIRHFEANNLLPRDKLKAINIAASNMHSVFAPDTLNAFIHNPDLAPIPNSLKLEWNNFQPFIEKLWE